MRFKVLCVLTALTGLASLPVARPALAVEAPATRPTSKPASPLAELINRLKSGPTNNADPATKPAKKFPTPAELINEMKAKKATENAKSLVVQIDFSSPMAEQPAGASLFGGGGVDLRTVLDRFAQARDDDECKAVLLTFFEGGMMNFAQAQEVRTALKELRDAGKRVFVYADSYDTMSYLVASAATDVCLMDGGEVFIPGVAVEPMFYRGALDMFGIKPEYVQIGEYKGAEEPYVNTEPSPELAGEMNKLVDALYGQIVGNISNGRSIKPKKVRALIDRAMIPAVDAQEAGLIDHLVDADGLRPLMQAELGNEVRVETEYGLPETPEVDASNPFALLAMMRPKQPETTAASIAVVYAEGVISGGEGGGGGLFGGDAGIGSEKIRRAMRLAERDDNVKAVVIRIDSPGGSALASEAMYQAVRRVAAKKPVVVSIGGMAASGGYYLACAGDYVLADPAAIVGSIGVVGGKMNLAGLYDMVGLSTATFARGKNADIYSETHSWDERQQKLIRSSMKTTYEQFTDRVMQTRGAQIKDIDQVARGRIFLAKDAKKLGMVDQLGGLDAAMAVAAERASLDEYDTVVLPAEEFNPLGGLNLGLPFGETPVKPAGGSAALLRLIPPHLREALGHVVRMNDLLSERPVVLMTPYVVRMR